MDEVERQIRSAVKLPRPPAMRPASTLLDDADDGDEDVTKVSHTLADETEHIGVERAESMKSLEVSPGQHTHTRARPCT